MRVVIQRAGHASSPSTEPAKPPLERPHDTRRHRRTDGKEDIDWLCKKIVNLRIFDDENGVMNKSILEADGEILVISQFTSTPPPRKATVPPTYGQHKPEISVPYCTNNSAGN